MKSNDPARILLTAFEPFGAWPQNASALCLNRLLPMLQPEWEVTTRIYPVEFEFARPLIETDLLNDYDLTLHLGQAQQTARIRLEAVGLNVGMRPGKPDGESFQLVPDGPAAYQSVLPLSHWAERLRAEGIPAYVSHHAGTYLCNATLYWGHHFIASHRLSTDLCFVHVPLDISQVAGLSADWMALPAELTAKGLSRLIEYWLEGGVPPVSTRV